IPVEVVPSEVGERHLLSVYVFLLLAHSRDVPVGVARKESCEHGVHLALHRRPCRKRTGFSPLTVRPCGQPRKPASAERRTLAERSWWNHRLIRLQGASDMAVHTELSPTE